MSRTPGEKETWFSNTTALALMPSFLLSRRPKGVLLGRVIPYIMGQTEIWFSNTTACFCSSLTCHAPRQAETIRKAAGAGHALHPGADGNPTSWDTCKPCFLGQTKISVLGQTRILHQGTDGDSGRYCHSTCRKRSPTHRCQPYGMPPHSCQYPARAEN